jgi:hypothetical protein
MWDPGAICGSIPSSMRLDDGFPWPMTTATGFLCTSMATAMQVDNITRPCCHLVR